MPDIATNPTTPVTNGANVTTANPLPVYLVGGIAATTITVGTTAVASGTASGILWNNAGTLASGPALTDTTGNVTLPAAGAFGWTSLSKIVPQADGILTLLNNGGTGFTRLQFGGTTSSFPAISRSGATIQFGLADASGWAGMQGGALEIRPDTALTAGGAANMRLSFSSSAVAVYAGSGAPSVSAPKGSLYLRSDGSGTGDRAYINTNGTTGWAAITTAS